RCRSTSRTARAWSAASAVTPTRPTPTTPRRTGRSARRLPRARRTSSEDVAEPSRRTYGKKAFARFSSGRPSEEVGMISIPEKAASKVQEIATAEDLLGQGLRLRVIGGGCAGFSYDLYFEDKPTEKDETFEDKGIKLYVDEVSYLYLEGTEIDYVEGL